MSKLSKKVNEEIDPRLDELRALLIESGLDEKKVNEAFQKFGEPKHTFYLVQSQYSEDGFEMCAGAYKNMTRTELSFCIMRDSDFEGYLFNYMFKRDKNRWKEFRDDKLLKTLIDKIESEKNWFKRHDVKSKYIERIYTKFYKPTEILDAINNYYNNNSDSWEDFGIFREDELPKFLKSNIFDNFQEYTEYTIYPPETPEPEPETPGPEIPDSNDPRLETPEPKIWKSKPSGPKTWKKY